MSSTMLSSANQIVANPSVAMAPTSACATFGSSTLTKAKMRGSNDDGRPKPHPSRPRKRLSWCVLDEDDDDLEAAAANTRGKEGFFELNNSHGRLPPNPAPRDGAESSFSAATTTGGIARFPRLARPPAGGGRPRPSRSMSFTSGSGRDGDGDGDGCRVGVVAATERDVDSNEATTEVDIPADWEGPDEEGNRRGRRAVKRAKSEPALVALDEESVVAAAPSAEAQEEEERGGFFVEEEDTARIERRDTAEPTTAAREQTDDDAAPKLKLFEPKFGAPPTPDTCDPNMDPDSFVKEMVRAYLGYTPQIRPALSLPEAFFPPLNEEHLAAYGVDVVSAVRENDLDAVRALHGAGRPLACCNRFGESLLHTACRRGHTRMFRFLVEEAHVGLRIRDDCGRTPLHDACWHRLPQYEIVEALLRRDPCLLLVGDKRGHTPFAYARREHWAVWRQFLSDRAQFIVQGLNQREVREIFAGSE